MPPPNPPNTHLPPHLREVCAILARGLVRLRSRAGEDFARDAEPARDRGDSSLHFTARQRRHAKPKPRRLA
jgi:hypothetical protein